MVMKMLKCVIVHTATCQAYTEDEHGSPCFKGDLVWANKDIVYTEDLWASGIKSVKEDTAGQIVDNLGAHGPAPLNVKWYQKDGEAWSSTVQVTYEDLTNESCVICDKGQNAGQALGPFCINPRGGLRPKCEDRQKATEECRKKTGLCKNKKKDVTVNGESGSRVCSGKAKKVCPEGKTCHKFGGEAPALSRWPRYSAYDEFQYPSPR